jgi:hypothetical protein
MLKSFKNLHQGERCFILGSGPSIKKQNLELLYDEFTFCSNWFVNHKDIKSINIDYFCAYDEAFVTPDINIKWQKKVLDINFQQKFFPKNWEQLNFGKNSTFLAYDHNTKLYEMQKYCVDIETKLIDGATVIINFCIPIAIHMGFKEIILLGIDNNYYKNGKLNPYFYDVSDHDTKFDSSKKRNDIWQKQTYKGYKLLAEYLQGRECKIIDATLNASLDVFEQVDFVTLFHNGEK